MRGVLTPSLGGRTDALHPTDCFGAALPLRCLEDAIWSEKHQPQVLCSSVPTGIVSLTFSASMTQSVKERCFRFSHKAGGILSSMGPFASTGPGQVAADHSCPRRLAQSWRWFSRGPQMDSRYLVLWDQNPRPPEFGVSASSGAASWKSGPGFITYLTVSGWGPALLGSFPGNNLSLVPNRRKGNVTVELLASGGSACPLSSPSIGITWPWFLCPENGWKSTPGVSPLPSSIRIYYPCLLYPTPNPIPPLTLSSTSPLAR